MTQARRVLDAVDQRYGLGLLYTDYDWGSDWYLRTGQMMPTDWQDHLKPHDAILFGAVGSPGQVPDHLAVWQSVLAIRRAFDQYINLRPARLFEGVSSPLANRQAGDIDFLVVRENTEGEYTNMGGHLFEGTERELVIQESVFTRVGVDRVLRHAFQLAASRPRKTLTVATKSNGISITMPFWDARVEAIAQEFPDVHWEKFHIDILCAHMVQHPDRFDVVVASNLFGDILSDLGPACTGTIGIAPSANLNPEGTFPSLFEPVHGSAPDIAGQNRANPVGMIWSAALMLSHLARGEARYAQAAAAMMRAIERTLAQGPRTPDMGGQATTAEVGQAIADTVAQISISEDDDAGLPFH